ncbi:hypothetical protein [Paenibacillus chibensis]|nr:hypothetical protein [Paenibacillus chibensis]MEC0373349.1 hypothetical protein [Paenibacillus chibensis]
MSVIVVISFIIVSSIVVTSKVYFFNPFTFKKDHITYLSWKNYKNPVSLTVEYYDDQFKGIHKSIQNKGEILHVLKELKTAPRTSHYIAPTSFDKSREFYQLTLLGNKNEVMLFATVYTYDQMVVVNKDSDIEETMKVSKEFMDYLNSL